MVIKLFDFLKNRDFLRKFSRLLKGKFKEFYHFEGDDDYYLRKTHFLQNGPKISLNDLKNIDSKQKRKLLKKSTSYCSQCGCPIIGKRHNKKKNGHDLNLCRLKMVKKIMDT